jgi:hypothetical protein
MVLSRLLGFSLIFKQITVQISNRMDNHILSFWHFCLRVREIFVFSNACWLKLKSRSFNIDFVFEFCDQFLFSLIILTLIHYRTSFSKALWTIDWIIFWKFIHGGHWRSHLFLIFCIHDLFLLDAFGWLGCVNFKRRVDSLCGR